MDLICCFVFCIFKSRDSYAPKVKIGKGRGSKKCPPFLEPNDYQLMPQFLLLGGKKRHLLTVYSHYEQHVYFYIGFLHKSRLSKGHTAVCAINQVIASPECPSPKPILHVQIWQTFLCYRTVLLVLQK